MLQEGLVCDRSFKYLVKGEASQTPAVQVFMLERQQALVCNSHLAATLRDVFDTHNQGCCMLRVSSCLPDNMFWPLHFARSKNV